MRTIFASLVLISPLSRAEHRWGGRNKARGPACPPQEGLSLAARRGEFPRAPAEPSTRRIKRDTGVFFCFVFFHVKENEETINKKAPQIGQTSPGPPPVVEDLNEN
jgi:hypothetical protein